MTPLEFLAVRATRSLGVLLMVIALARCAGAATTAPSSSPVPSPTPAASASAPNAEPTATPMPTLRTAYDLPPYGELVKLFDYDTEGAARLQGHVRGAAGRRDRPGHPRTPVAGMTCSANWSSPTVKAPSRRCCMPPATTVSPSFFLPEMVTFAKEGYAGLAIGNRPGPRAVQHALWEGHDRGLLRDYVVDLRRGIDLFGTLPQIDATRIGFVGHSLGCAVGNILSGIETRIGAYALMACGGYITHPEWSFCSTDACFSATDDDRSQYQDRLAVLNPVNYIGRGGGAAFLVQASKTDQIALESNVVALYDAAPQPKILTWYERVQGWFGGHGRPQPGMPDLWLVRPGPSRLRGPPRLAEGAPVACASPVPELRLPAGRRFLAGGFRRPGPPPTPEPAPPAGAPRGSRGGLAATPRSRADGEELVRVMRRYSGDIAERRER